MSIAWHDIRAIIEHRRSQETALKRLMIEIRDRYHGDYVIPLPSVKGQPEMDAPVPRLIADGIDGGALYAASTRPVISVPALDPTKEKGVRSREFAAIRRRAYYATWYKSQFDVAVRKAYRQLIGYGEMAWVVVPDFETGMPRIEFRDALTSYPEPRTAEDIRRPKNAAFVYGRSGDWIAANFPEANDIVGKHNDRQAIWDVAEWIDEDDVVIGVIGPREMGATRHYHNEADLTMELRRWPNRAGRCTAVSTRRVTLDRVAGQMENVIGVTDLMAKMMALDVLAAEKAIFPDRFVIGADGRPPQLLSGDWQDGRTGRTNILSDVVEVGEMQSSPGPLTHPVLDRLESAARQSGGIHPSMSGLQPGSNLRTGRAIDSHQAFTIEPRIQEMQELMARAATFINESVHDVYTGYWNNKKYHIFSGWPSDTGLVDFTPSDHFESDANVVTYNYPGTDAAGAAVTTAQMVGAGMMSRHTGMTRHPYVEDSENEHKLIIEESLEQAVLLSVQQAASSGAMPVIDLARIKQLVQEGHAIDEAVRRADEEARRRQATQAPEPGEGEIAAPQTQPGLSPPGIGAEQPSPEGPPTIEAPGQGQQNLRQLLVALRRS